MKRALVFWVLAAAIAGCGGKVVADGSPATTTIGSGGSGAGGATGTVCGGEAGIPCAVGEYCLFDPPGSCGGFDNTGVCVPGVTEGCPPDCPGVCGCDGLFYCSACAAHASGVDVSSTGSCDVAPEAGYHAYGLPTNALRYLITKVDPALDRCVMVIVSDVALGAYPDVQVTMGWSVERALVTPHASDCAPDSTGLPAIPPASVAQADASGAKGSIKHDNASWPCWVTIDVALAFTPSAPWTPPSESLQADMVFLENSVCEF